MPDPGLPGGDMSSCIDHFMETEGLDEESAARLCQSLKEEEKADNGDPQALLDAIQNGAGLIADVAVDFNSAVDVPAVDSKWVMMKSASDGPEEYDHKVTAATVFKQDADTEKRISYAPAMIPREPDKEGDVVPTPVVERAAHGYLENDGEVDTDHSLVDGKGAVVESWIEPTAREWDLPGGGTETYPAGTWMVGIKWDKEPWDRIKSGELTGLSIYGQAEHITLERAALPTAKSMTLADGVVAVEWDEADWDLLQRRLDAAETDETGDNDKGQVQESKGMGDESTTDDPEGGDDVTISEVAASVDDLADTVSAMKEAVETEKADEQEAAATIAEAYDDVAPGDVLDLVEMAASRGLEDVKEAVESAKAEDEDDDEEDDDEAEMSAEKRADDANIEKGGNGTTTAAKGIEDDDSGPSNLSYAAVAEDYQGEN